jgi:predicted metalloenzyme YecM
MELEVPVQVLPDYFEAIEYVNHSIRQLIVALQDNQELANVIYNSSPDHIGVRVTSIDEYQAKKAALGLIGEMVSEAIIPMNLQKGRPIAIFKLDFPLHTIHGDVSYIELPAPRVGVEEVNMYDHIEMVLPKSITLLDFILQYGNVLIAHGLCNQAQIDEAMRDIAAHKTNPEITLTGLAFKVRFHENDIGTVVESEKGMFKLEELGRTYDLLHPGVRG